MALIDLTMALRALTRRPGFALTAVLLLALGAGSNAAVFSVVRAVLLRPLPFAEPDRLVAIGPRVFISQQDEGYLSQRARSLQAVAAQSPGWLMSLVAAGGEPLKVTGAKVTGNFFSVLGTAPAVGRAFAHGEDATGRHRVAVLSHALWQTRFGGDPRALGRSIQLDGDDHVVIGVMPHDFEIFGPGTDLWVPLPFDPTAPWHTASFMQAFARLAPGATPASASRELQALLPAMRRELAHDDEWGRTLAVAPLRETLVGDVRDTLLVLLGAVATLLLLVSVNLGTLMLGRGVERTHELAVRTALGASRARLVRQLLTEHAIVAFAGATGGLALAWTALPLLIARIPSDMPRVGEIRLDLSVFFTVLGVATGVSLLLALVPALLAARSDLQPMLREARTTETPSRRRALGALVAAQGALAVVLGIGAGLMLRTLWNLQHVDPGFAPDRVLTFRLQTTSAHEDLSTGLPYLEQVAARVRALPGVTVVGSTGHLPMSGYAWNQGVVLPDEPLAPGAAPPQVGWRFVHGDYFRAMGIPLRLGRAFDYGDTSESPAVVIVNEAFARRFFGSPAAALGEEFLQQGSRQPPQRVRIVGISGDVRHQGLSSEPPPELYRPLTQTFMFPMAFVVRTDGPPAQLAGAVRQAAYDVDPTIPVAEMQPLATVLADSLARPRLLALLLSVFAAAGLLLEIVGVYGVVAYRVRQREREFGVRMALGAAPSRIARLIVEQGALLAIAGVAIGLPAAMALARLVESVVYGITPRDPLTFTLLPVVVIAATIAACGWPAIRASRTDPAITLRSD
jgi:putative ABC transport system permease protein